MSIIAEELVEEWLNIQGYFTIRGVRVGTGEMDLLAVQVLDGAYDCWHYEVSGSLRPMGYVSDLAKGLQKTTGKKARSAIRRGLADLKVGVDEWVQKKFLDPEKEKTRQSLWQATWRFGFVVAKVKHQEEIPLLEEHGIRIVWLREILKDLKRRRDSRQPPIQAASWSDLVDLVMLDHARSETGSTPSDSGSSGTRE